MTRCQKWCPVHDPLEEWPKTKQTRKTNQNQNKRGPNPEPKSGKTNNNEKAQPKHKQSSVSGVQWDINRAPQWKGVKMAACVPSIEQAIHWKPKRTDQKHHKDGPWGAKAKKSQCRNPGSPQPGSRRSHCEAVQAWLAPMHIDHVDMPGEWKRGGETTVRHTEWKRRNNEPPPVSQSPLMCALTVILMFLLIESCMRIEMAVGSVAVAVLSHDSQEMKRWLPPRYCSWLFPLTPYVLPFPVLSLKKANNRYPAVVAWVHRAVENTPEHWAICNPLTWEQQFGWIESSQLRLHEVACVATSGSPLLWSVSLNCRQLDCAISCTNCSCCVVTVCSMTLARASTLTCRLLRHLFAAWRVLLSLALINPSRGTFCCIRLHTSSRCCWVSCNFSAYARSKRRSRASFLPCWVGTCDWSGMALLALQRCWCGSKEAS